MSGTVNPFAASDEDVGACGWFVSNFAASIVVLLFCAAPLLACTVTCWPDGYNIICAYAAAGICLGYNARHDGTGEESIEDARRQAAKVDTQVRLLQVAPAAGIPPPGSAPGRPSAGMAGGEQYVPSSVQDAVAAAKENGVVFDGVVYSGRAVDDKTPTTGRLIPTPEPEPPPGQSETFEMETKGSKGKRRPWATSAAPQPAFKLGDETAEPARGPAFRLGDEPVGDLV